jgi:two-component system, OmpR family, sensor histidine kinase CpxA
MKVSYPLSLKVSLWLMLNLLLLAALGIGFLVVRGGISWSALVAGPSGDRMQSLANVIAGEAAVATGEARTAVLKRFGDAYDAEFYLFNIDEGQVAGKPVELPAEVRARMEFRPPHAGPPGFGPRGGRRGRGDFDAARRPDPLEKGSRESGERDDRDRPPPEKAARESFEKGSREAIEKGPRPTFEKGGHDPEKGRGGPEMRRDGPGFGGPPGEVQWGRFVVRAGKPSAYWVGLRVPFYSSERGFLVPAKLVARVNSMWGLLHLLNLESWVLAATGVVALSVLFWLPLVHGITRSITQLTAATEQIAEGRFETRITARRRDELGKLGESVNRMATRLDAHMTGQKRFLGDVAHELCSPLARLQMATGILGDQAPPTLQATVADVREEVQQMSTLVNELLAFTKAGLRPRDVVSSPIELASLVREVVAREDPSGRVTLNIPEGVSATAERELLGRAIANLVRNALRYAGEAGPITVTAAPDDAHTSIVVEDNGPGVPAADLDRLGEPFFRPELARTRESGGVGLGLAIVRNSIAACGGEVRFSNRSPRGFRAEIRLPAA